MTKKLQTGLGKGLSALIPTIKVSDNGIEITADENEEKSGNFYLIDLKKIVRNQYQPRLQFDEKELEDLANSIIEHGVIQPITVRRSVNGYELISGERRWRASQKAGLTKIPAYVLENVSDTQMLVFALVENLVRADLNPIEEANAYKILAEECNLTHDEIAQKVSKDRTSITNTLRLLKLPEIIQNSLRDNEISMGHARALLGINDKNILIKVWEKIISESLSVRATENLIKDINSGKVVLTNANNKSVTPKQNKKPNVSREVAVLLEDYEKKLQHKFATKVVINPKNEDSGTIMIDFYTKDDLSRIFDLIGDVKYD